jgi:hypothetical protein
MRLIFTGVGAAMTERGHEMQERVGVLQTHATNADSAARGSALMR